ncbi:MAG: His-Xaa-Ser system radical SAM maturase HxsB [Pseudomonadales bacterium]
MRLLPFNFDRLESGDYFLSNMAGFHTFLGHDSLIELINFSKTSCHNDNVALESALFIAQEQRADVALSAMGSALAKKLQYELQFNPTFMIVPTLRCDHTCTYCQVSRAPLNAQNYDLEPAAVPVIISTIKKLSDAPYKLEIQGGEPLLRFDLIQQLYDEAVEQLGLNSFTFVIATSLSLLTDDIVVWAKERDIFFSTSLDGSALVHNKNRILPGNDSFQRVKDAVTLLRNELGEDRVATVTTVTQELLEHPDSLIEAHLEMGLNDMFVRPISPYGFANSKASIGYNMKEYMAFYERLLDSIFSHNAAGVPLVEHSAAIHMKRILNPGFSQYADLKSPSGFLLNSVLFNYDGKVYGSDESRMLQRALGKIDFSCGLVDTIELTKNDLYRNVVSSSFNLLHPGCESCAYQPFCGTDPCQNISTQGEPVGDKSRSTFCQYHMAMFRFLLQRFHSSAEYKMLLKGWAHD